MKPCFRYKRRAASEFASVRQDRWADKALLITVFEARKMAGVENAVSRSNISLLANEYSRNNLDQKVTRVF